MLKRQQQENGEAENIDPPSVEMTEQLKQIWSVCFGDSREYIDFYFAHRFRPEEMLVCLAEGQPVSMLSLLPAQLCHEGHRLPIRYVYAVATLPEYRGKGYARLLLEEAFRRLQAPLALLPASASLREYYGRLGFRDAFALDEYCITPEEIAACGSEGNGQEYWLLTVTPGEYRRIREEYFGREGIFPGGYVSWEESAVAYALLENDFVDGYAYKVQHHGREDILLFREEDNMLRVIETTLPAADVTAVMKRLRVKCPVAVRTAAGMLGQPKAVRAGRAASGMMLGGPDITDGYLNLTLE